MTCKRYSKESGKTTHFVPCFRKKLTDASVLFVGIKCAIDFDFKPDLSKPDLAALNDYSTFFHKTFYVGYESSYRPIQLYMKKVATQSRFEKGGILCVDRSEISFRTYIEKDTMHDVSSRSDHGLIKKMRDISMHGTGERQNELDLVRCVIYLRFAMREYLQLFYTFISGRQN